jgi:DNA mismatch repair protein MutL
VPVAKQAAGITVAGFVAALVNRDPRAGLSTYSSIDASFATARSPTRSSRLQRGDDQGAQPGGASVHRTPADRVDVNVHPTKAEVRFLDQSLVHEVLRRAIVDALGATTAPELVLSAAASAAPSWPQAAPLPLGFGRTADAGAAASGAFATFGSTPARRCRPQANWRWRTRIVAGCAGRHAGRSRRVASLIQPMTPLGQFRNTFIIAMDDEGVAIIDQHVAHERILFEQISERLTTRALESQRLLSPVVLDVSPGEHQTLLSHAEALTNSVSSSRISAAAASGLGPCRRCSTGADPRRPCAPSRLTSTGCRRAPVCMRRCAGWRRRWPVMRRSRRTIR